uniref:Uncharacterized protein n=1 Tax=viral metagenome TaxID=1070528 RepID=A0A6C0KYT2_9ZZZZ
MSSRSQRSSPGIEMTHIKKKISTPSSNSSFSHLSNGIPKELIFGSHENISSLTNSSEKEKEKEKGITIEELMRRLSVVNDPRYQILASRVKNISEYKARGVKKGKTKKYSKKYNILKSTSRRASKMRSKMRSKKRKY